MKKRYSGRLSPAAVYIGLTLLCVGLLGLVGCADPIAQEGNQIVSFVIGTSRGAINDEARTITVTLPGDTDLTAALKPEIKISAGATVDPASGAEVILKDPIAYVVQAENGELRHYTVRAVLDPETVLTEISVAPKKTIYDVGVASIPPADVVVTGHYQDGSTKIEDTTGVTTSLSANTVGKQTVLVIFNGKSATYEVEFIEFEGLESISAAPIKTIYDVGDAADEIPVTDVVVTGTYKGGLTKTETTGVTLGGYDASKAGIQTVVVTLNGKTTTYKVEFIEFDGLEKISVTLLRTTNYDNGEEIDPDADILVIGTYSDGSTKPEVIELTDLSGYDKDKAGLQTVKVTFNGKTDTFKVTWNTAQDISDLTGLSVTQLQSTFVSGTSLDDILDQTVVTGTYSDGTTAKITTVTAADVSGYNADRVGSSQTLRVAVGEKSATFTVTLTAEKIPANLTSLSATTFQPDNTFPEGSSIDDILAKTVITGTYSDGTTAKITTVTAADVSGYDPTNFGGSQTLRVVIGERATTFTVIVSPDKIPANLTGLSVTYQQQTTFVNGTPIEDILAKTVITGTYADGTSEIQTPTAADVIEYDPNRIGSQTLRVVIGPRFTTFGVTIQAKPGDAGFVVEVPGEKEITFYINDGINPITLPPDEIIRLKAKDLPQQLVISTQAFSTYAWTVDNSTTGVSASSNISTNIALADRTWGNRHNITLVVTTGGKSYSRTIWFVLEN